MHKVTNIMEYQKPQEGHVEILLSTYNGELYLEELLNSVLVQSYTDWKMLIRDDGSIDSTLDIIVSYQEKYPGRFLILNSRNSNLGPVQSYGKLLKCSKASFLALCDQDDVWMPGKLEKQMKVMRKVQDKFGWNVPVLVHTDLTVCDDKMECLSGSFWKYQYIDPDKMKDIRCLLIQNFVTGCTVLMNRSLVDCVLPIPEGAIMFDWWFALIAQQLGKIETIHEPLIKYRQHNDNTIGAKKWGVITAAYKFYKEIDLRKKSLFETKLQAQALMDHLGPLNKRDSEFILLYVKMFEKSWFLRKREYIDLRIKKYGILRQIVTWIII